MYITVASSASVSYAGKSYRDDGHEINISLFFLASVAARAVQRSRGFIACCDSSW